MKIYEMLGINEGKKEIISLVGAGGKSTIMQALAEECKGLGKRVLVTTSTRVLTSQLDFCDRLFYGHLADGYRPLEGSTTGLAKRIKGPKAIGMNLEELEEIHRREIFDLIIIEADGARTKPIKAHGPREPMVAPFSTITLGVIGLDSLGRPIDEDNVYRPELLSGLLQVNMGDRLKEGDLARYVLDRRGLFKDSRGKKVLFLNKAKGKKHIEQGQRIGKLLKDMGFDHIYVTDIGMDI
ncbi:MAG: selenium cofactor biosynthesis protein YqeC [Tissierellaceae bacterium]